MNINTRAKALIGAVAIGGAAIAMGGAFTAGGIDDASLPPAQFVGGQAGQSITGAALTSVDYFSADGLKVDRFDVTLGADAGGKTVAGTFTDGTETHAYECEETPTTAKYECTPTAAGTKAPTTDGTTLNIVVSNPAPPSAIVG